MKKILIVALIALVAAGTLFAGGAKEDGAEKVYRLRTSTNLGPTGTVGRGL
jgi:hypothetical protein